MGFLIDVAEVAGYSICAVLVLLFSAIVFEVSRRRHNHAHLEAPPVFEDPNSLNQVRCPSMFDPPEKYMSVIVPAYNEENRLPEAIDETLNFLQKRAAEDKSFTYEVIIVDDGSKDGTRRVAFSNVKKFSVDNVRVILLGEKLWERRSYQKTL